MVPVFRSSHFIICDSHGRGGSGCALVQVVQLKGVGAIYRELVGVRLGGGGTYGIRDDYEWWSRDYTSDTRGKLLPLMREDPEVHQVFLDDYIEEDRASIVDARDVGGGAPIAFADTRGVHLLRVDTVQAVLDEQYYVKLFESSVRPHL
jgi:hypothetical protein